MTPDEKMFSLKSGETHCPEALTSAVRSLTADIYPETAGSASPTANASPRSVPDHQSGRSVKDARATGNGINDPAHGGYHQYHYHVHIGATSGPGLPVELGDGHSQVAVYKDHCPDT